MSYRLGVANIYELLSDDNGEAIAKVKADQKKSEPAPVAKTQTKAATSSTSSSQQQNKRKPQTDRKNDRAQSYDGKGPQQKREKPPRLEGSNNDQGAVEGERRRSRPEGARGPRGEGRGRREGGQNESSDGFRGPSNKRVFDRKSGTGRGREYNKKGGSGKGNWGTVSDDRTAQEEGAKEEETEETVKAEAEKGAESQDAEKKDSEAKTEEKQAEPDPDEKLKTLDDYLKEVKKPTFALPQPRKPGEGEKNASWANFVPLKRDDESSQDSPKEEKRNKEAKSSAVRVDDVIDIKFPQEERRGFGRGRGERSDRGGQRGQKGGRGPRQNKQSAPNFSDESSFPALSTKA